MAAGTGRVAIAAALIGAAGSAHAQCTPQFGDRFDSADLNTTAQALAAFNDGSGLALFAGGAFTAAGGQTANRIARWTSYGWSPVGQGFNNTVSALVVFDDGTGPALYAAGAFTQSGATAITRVARWTGAAWVGLGSGLNSTVNAMAVFDEDHAGPLPPRLIVGGDFTLAGGLAAAHLARWDGAAWTQVGGGCDAAVEALTVHGGAAEPDLYVGGSFLTAGGVTVNRVARWDGQAFNALGVGASATVTSLASFDADGPGDEPARLIAGGDFTTIGGLSANRIASWNGTAWFDLGAGVNGTVRHMNVWNDGVGEALFVAGSFTQAGGATANRIARWDGTAWSSLTATGLDGAARAILPYNDGRGARLFVAGDFGNAGGARALRVATWNGSIWSGLDRGPELGVHALAVHAEAGSPALYLAGDFLRADGIEANRVARFDNRTFSALGPGIANGAVNALASFTDGAGPGLFAAGTFTTAGGATANRIARWNGTSWSPLMVAANNGVNSTVNALLVWNDGTGPALYATGSFSTAGGTSAMRVARWNGTAWAPLGVGLSGTGEALAVYNDGAGEALYVGGSFTIAGGQNANRIAKWTGSAWTPLGLGLNNTVTALAAYNGLLYVGGTFTIAGSVSVNRIAAWNGAAWSDVGGGVNAGVNTLIPFDHDGPGGASPMLIVGGAFTTAGGLTANHVARWDGAAWSTMGPAAAPGADGNVNAAAILGAGSAARLYLGGDFLSAGDQSNSHLAAWFCPCYANCDDSYIQPVLNVLDFNCFLNRFTAGDAYANCDGSTTPPVLNVLDFNCFLNRFGAGCP